MRAGIPPSKSTMLHVGYYKMYGRRVACRAAWCTTCKRPTVAEGMEYDRIMHLCFIPLARTGTAFAWVCPICRKDVNRHRPKDPRAIRRMARFGWGMLALALLIAALNWRNPGFDRTGVLCFAAGMPFFIGLAEYWHRQAQGSRHEQDVASVRPLKGDRCPLCEHAMAAGRPPRCGRCDVVIDTEAGPVD